MGFRFVPVRLVAVLLAVIVPVGCAAHSDTAVPSPTAVFAVTPTASSSAPVSPTLRPLSPSASPTEAVATFAVHLPKGWQKVDMTAAAVDGLLKTMSSTNPQLVDALQQSLTAGSVNGMVYWAMDFRNLTYISNVNVIERDVPEGMSLDLVEALNKAQLEQIPGAHLVSAAQEQRTAGTMILLRYSLDLNVGPNRSITVDERQFYFLRQAHLYILSFSCALTSTTCPADVETIIDSFAPTA